MTAQNNSIACAADEGSVNVIVECTPALDESYPVELYCKAPGLLIIQLPFPFLPDLLRPCVKHCGSLRLS